jgi:hypothetical protein
VLAVDYASAWFDRELSEAGNTHQHCRAMVG